MSSDFFYTFQPETRHWTQLLSQKSNWASASFSLIFLSGFVEAFALFHVPHAAYSHRAISPTQLASGGCVPAQLPARVELYWLKDERQGKHSSLVSCASRTSPPLSPNTCTTSQGRACTVTVMKRFVPGASLAILWPYIRLVKQFTAGGEITVERKTHYQNKST